MTMPQLKDDLFTEILNQDKKYKSQRKLFFKSFKEKIKDKRTAKGFFLNWFKFGDKQFVFRGAVSLVVALGILVFIIVYNNPSNKQISHNANNILTKDKSIFLQEQNVSSDESNYLKAKVGGIISTEASKESSENLKEANKIVTKNSGQFVEFLYNTDTQLLEYKGFTIENSCNVLKSLNIERSGDKFILKYAIEKKQDKCDLEQTKLDIRGEVKIELSLEQRENFASLFLVERVVL